MKYLSEFRDPQAARCLLSAIEQRNTGPVTFMEVCGTHTVSIFRSGIRHVLPEQVRLISGPGCPVCVTANRDIDWAISFAGSTSGILATFGDMLKVPGSRSSLQRARAEGADVRIVYSTLDALALARANPNRAVVFFGVGFETTAPTIACSVLEAEAAGISNYFVYSAHKTMPAPMRALMEAGEVKIDGLICPGHVSTIIGSEPYRFLADEFHTPCVITGFEPLDILQGVDMLLAQREDHRADVEIAYRRVVRPRGNRAALEILYRVFEPGAAEWRGIGTIPGSGLAFRREYGRFDAARVFSVDPGPSAEHKGCRCGDVIRGAASPPECRLYARACTPENPVGPCMVSSEGSCSAWYQFSGVAV